MTAPAAFQGSLLGIGNPLLDISAVVKQDFLDKYGVRGGREAARSDSQHHSSSSRIRS